eukprot:4483145-Pleurochrysis_carterae.AAC.1
MRAHALASVSFALLTNSRFPVRASDARGRGASAREAALNGLHLRQVHKNEEVQAAHHLPRLRCAGSQRRMGHVRLGEMGRVLMRSVAGAPLQPGNWHLSRSHDSAFRLHLNT